MKMHMTQSSIAPGAVRVRARGTMGPREAEYFLRACTALPLDVHSIRLDLTTLEDLDPSALSIVQAFVVRWHLHRPGSARVEFSPQALRASIGAKIRLRARHHSNDADTYADRHFESSAHVPNV